MNTDQLTTHVASAITTALTTARLVHHHDVPRFTATITPVVVEHVLDWATARDGAANDHDEPDTTIES